MKDISTILHPDDSIVRSTRFALLSNSSTGEFRGWCPMPSTKAQDRAARMWWPNYAACPA
jgi:hypothetical protein